MTVIRIQECSEQAGTFRAKISFNQGSEYEVSLRDPFSKEEEERLEWYFEEHLKFPFTDQVKAQQAATSITTYGERLFAQVFAGNSQILSAYKAATQEGLSTIQIEIVGQSSFHALHWEALKDPELSDPLVLQAAIVRKNLLPQALHTTMSPSPTINLLIVVARPHGRVDVGYRTISEPLVEALGHADIPMQVDILRPGTYKALKNHLHETTNKRGVGYYHVIHFDVHGSLRTYDSIPSWIRRRRYDRQDLPSYGGLRAFLSLEGEQEGITDLMEAGELAALLLQHQIPIAILNACQSAKQTGEDETSLGSHLMQAGVPMVIAMGYSITVSAAQLLMRVLYQQLFAGRDLSVATREARAALHSHKKRRAYFNQHIGLEDWLLPVAYQNQPVQFQPREFTPEEQESYYRGQTKRYVSSQPSYGFVGRDLDILQIEKRLLAKRNILLIRGMGGVGKTALLQHLGTWWQTTGFVDQVCYLSYYERAWTHKQLLAEIAERMLGEGQLSASQPLSLHAQQVRLTQHLRAQRHLLVLDNLESIAWPLDEQAALRRFLASLTDGRTLVLLGSRGDEAWLAEETFGENRYDLEGLDAEAVSVLAGRILEQQGVKKECYNTDLVRLLMILDGFPLALEAVLANLSHQTPKEILNSLQSGNVALDKKNNQEKTKSILCCVDHSYRNLSPEIQDLLFCLMPYTLVISRPFFRDYIDLLRQQTVLSSMPLDCWEEMLRQAENRGLLKVDPNAPYFLRLHPLLSYFLRTRLTTQEDLERRKAVENAFLQLYQRLGEVLSDQVNFKQPASRKFNRKFVDLEFENFMTALDLALVAQSPVGGPFFTLSGYLGIIEAPSRTLELAQYVLDRLRSFPKQVHSGLWALETASILHFIGKGKLGLRMYGEAEASFQTSMDLLVQLETLDEKSRSHIKASAYYNMALVAVEQREWIKAEEYCKEAEQIYASIDKPLEQALVYHQLGKIAEEQQLLANAEQYYQQALQIQIEFNDRQPQADNYLQLGILTSRQGRLIEAQEHYHNALLLYTEFNERTNLAAVYHQLGMLAEEQGWWTKAKHYHRQALQIRLDLDDHSLQALSYAQLGHVAVKESQLAEAVHYYQKSLLIFKKFNDLPGQNLVYFGLATLAMEQKQWKQAEEYYQRALHLVIELNNHETQATIFHQLGFVASQRHQWAQAEEYYLNALSFYRQSNDHRTRSKVCAALGTIAKEQRQWTRAEGYYQELLQTNIEINDRSAQAEACYQCAALAEEQHQWGRAEDYYQQALHLVIELNDRHQQAWIYHRLGRATQEQHHLAQAQEYYLSALPLFSDFNDHNAIASISMELGLIAFEQEQWTQAEDYYQRALRIFVDLDDRIGQAYSYDNLGVLSQGQKQRVQAESYYQAALQIYTELDDRLACGGSFHNLGNLALEQEQWSQAEEYYQLALEVFIEFDDLYNQAGSYYQLGIVALEQSHWPQARTSFLSALKIYRAYEDADHLKFVLGGFARLRQSSSDTHLPAVIASILDVTPQDVDILLDQMLDDEADVSAK